MIEIINAEMYVFVVNFFVPLIEAKMKNAKRKNTTKWYILAIQGFPPPVDVPDKEEKW